MASTKDLVAELAWETATRVVELLRWDREEQRAEAFVEIVLVIENGFERLLAARCRDFLRAAAEPGRN
jgi:hypothetical protein